MKRFALIIATSLLGLVTVLGTAAAQEPPAAASQGRDGLVIGFGINGGDIDVNCDECGTGLNAGGAELHVGTFLKPGLAFILEMWSMRHSETLSDGFIGDVTLHLDHILLTAGAQYWVAPRIWLKGGIGLGVARGSVEADGIPADAMSSDSEAGLAFSLAAGYEVVTFENFAIDVQFRLGAGVYGDSDTGEEVEARNVAFGLGFTWL